MSSLFPAVPGAKPGSGICTCCANLRCVEPDNDATALTRAHLLLDARPAGVSLTERFTRLLDEPLIPSALAAG